MPGDTPWCGQMVSIPPVQGTQGHGDMGVWGQWSQRETETGGVGTWGTGRRGNEDTVTWGHRDMGIWRSGEGGMQEQEDMGTRGWQHKAVPECGIVSPKVAPMGASPTAQHKKGTARDSSPAAWRWGQGWPPRGPAPPERRMQSKKQSNRFL